MRISNSTRVKIRLILVTVQIKCMFVNGVCNFIKFVGQCVLSYGSDVLVYVRIKIRRCSKNPLQIKMKEIPILLKIQMQIMLTTYAGDAPKAVDQERDTGTSRVWLALVCCLGTF